MHPLNAGKPGCGSGKRNADLNSHFPLLTSFALDSTLFLSDHHHIQRPAFHNLLTELSALQLTTVVMAHPPAFAYHYLPQPQERVRRQNQSCTHCRRSKKACDGYLLNGRAAASNSIITPSSDGSCELNSENWTWAGAD